MFYPYLEISFIVTLFLLFVLRPVAVKLNFVDHPNTRKNHKGKIPLIGGISIFLGLITSQIYLDQFDKFSYIILVTTSLILILGILDDFLNLRAKIRLIMQAFLILAIIYLTDLKITTFGNLLGLSNPLELGFLSIPITVIAVIGLTNAFNMIDGIDGLGGGLSLIAFAGIYFFNGLLVANPFTNIILAIAVSLVPFLIFNLIPSSKLKVFLGDGGSLFIGFIVSWALIYSAENLDNFVHSAALWCVAIPLFDFFSVIIVRIFEKRSLIVADRDHIHHLLPTLGYSKKITLILIISTGIIMLLIGFKLEQSYPTLSFPVFMALFFFYLFMRFYYFLKKK